MYTLLTNWLAEHPDDAEVAIILGSDEHSRLLWLRFYRQQTMAGRYRRCDSEIRKSAGTATRQCHCHGTTGERPVERFERDERSELRALAKHPYRRLGVRQSTAPQRRVPATVPVQRRSLQVYARAVR